MGNTATQLRPEIIEDLENTTAFTAEEIREYYRHFMDGTASGRMTVSKEEFVEAYKKLFPDGDATKFAEHVFNHFDTDENGRLDFREFLSSLSVQLKGTLSEKLEWVFNLYDLDNTGTISRGELTEICKSVKALGKVGALPENILPEDMASHIMEKADHNKDNELCKNEFLLAASGSKTMQSLISGSMNAASSPFMKRKAMGPSASN